MQTQTSRNCLVTGAGGYLGGCVKSALRKRGWQVTELTRRPKPGAAAIEFHLGADVPAASLSGAPALVHCAYDFGQIRWDDIGRVNVVGTEKLLRAAREAKVERLVYISSISAFNGCRSLYGKAKLECERVALQFGATVIRPGLIYGEPPGAMFGRLVKQVKKGRVLPLFGGGAQLQYLVHEQDLTGFICRCVEGEISPPPVAVTIAHEQPWSFRQILEELARWQGKSLKFVPAPWRLIWAGLKLAEALRIPLEFRSDSLVSLMYQNPNPDFAPQRRLGITCRPFGGAT
jgi:nucleoside-diphosphate-sugar epimerase